MELEINKVTITEEELNALIEKRIDTMITDFLKKQPYHHSLEYMIESAVTRRVNDIESEKFEDIFAKLDKKQFTKDMAKYISDRIFR